MNRAALVLAALGLTALGCTLGGGVPGEALNDPITERLVMAPYPAAPPWRQVSDRHTREGSVAVWIPPDQDAKAPRDSLTQRVLLGRGKLTASELASELAKDIARGCESARIEGPRRGTEDGNDVAYAEVTCSFQQLVLLKVIRGHEALYVAEREFRDEPSAAALREANAYLAEKVILCPVMGGLGRCR
ncbi:MAG TPA: hypothetical protein VKF60_06685 [Myxococcota bacterium]|nr:hypothetical protein [Myxococcota bacterium]